MGKKTLIKHDKQEKKGSDAVCGPECAIHSWYTRQLRGLYEETGQGKIERGAERKGMNTSQNNVPIYYKIAALAEFPESSNLVYICIIITKTIFCSKGTIVSETSNSIPCTYPEKTTI